jgi:hypothetical protein
MHLKGAPDPLGMRESTGYGQGRSWPKSSRHDGATAGDSNSRKREEQ